MTRQNDALNRKPKKRGAQRVVAIVERACFAASWLTVAFLLSQPLIRRAGVAIPGWVPAILVAAAVAYLTNWLAIEMLFKPYRENKWLFFWRQGLVPRNKDKIAKQVGKQVEAELLTPEMLTNKLSGSVLDFLRDPASVRSFRKGAQALLAKHEKTINDALIPQIEEAVIREANAFLSDDGMRKFWADEIEPRLKSQETRAWIASRLVDALQERAPRLAAIIKPKVVAMIEDYLRQKIPMLGLGNLLAPIAAGLADMLISEERLAEDLKKWLQEEKTFAMFGDEIMRLVEHARKAMNTPEVSSKYAAIAEEARNKIRNFMRDNLPKMAGELLKSENLWSWVETELLPQAQPAIETWMQAHGKQIVSEKLKVSEMVEEAIRGQSVEKFHALINDIAAEHLGAILVLGYVLGALVGAAQHVLQ